MAPSPTGYLHIGTARTTLFNYLFAKRYGGTFIMRIEDTDKERSKKEYEEEQLEGLKWLGFSWDEFYRQSERNPIYRKELERLIAEGKAKESEEESAKEPGKRVKVIRLLNPGKKITFLDEVRGEITFDTKELGDFVIARSLDDALYHFTVVVDDAFMDITHVIRGEDHISNTGRQILIQEGLGYKRPKYAHLPLILASDRSKMSKRHGATTVREYREEGILPEALVNFLALLGWNPGDDREIMPLKDLMGSFDLKRIQQSGGIFDREKLLWYNREYLRKLSAKEFKERLLAFAPEYQKENVEKLLPLVQERASTLKEAALLLSSAEFSFVKEVAPYDGSRLVPTLKDKTLTREEVKKHLEQVIELIEGVSSELSMDSAKEAIFGYATEQGRGAVLWPVRYALAGADKSPDPFTIAGLIGKEETLQRLRAAVQKL